MVTGRQFTRSHALKLAATLCLVSALAFLLGQGVAAFRMNSAQPRTAHTPPQAIERVSGAQGTIPAPPAPTHTANASTTSSGTVATTAAPSAITSGPVALSANLTRAAPPGHVDHARGKDKPHGKHKKAAGDSSHGGLASGAKASQPARQHDGNGSGPDNGHGNKPGNKPGGDHGK